MFPNQTTSIVEQQMLPLNTRNNASCSLTGHGAFDLFGPLGNWGRMGICLGLEIMGERGQNQQKGAMAS